MSFQYYNDDMFDYSGVSVSSGNKTENATGAGETIEYYNPLMFDYQPLTKEDEIKAMLKKHCKDEYFIEQYMNILNMSSNEVDKLIKQHKQNVKNNRKLQKKMKKKNKRQSK